jgi:hypothetical protein
VAQVDSKVECYFSLLVRLVLVYLTILSKALII